ncbi:MAG: AIR synthase related protein [Clostridiales bacterium]|nr:AIR synthase related protein [Clostridiales bacterium]MDY3746489.1 AIR synthase related protein [Lachnospiraceae bacterium]
MITGKCPESILKRSVLKQLNQRQQQVICRPGIGQGSAVFKVPSAETDGVYIVTHTASFSGSPKEAACGAVHGAAAALMAKGAVPVGLETAVLMPPDYPESQLKQLMTLLDETCGIYDMEILGGHTEYMPVIGELTVTVTAAGYTNEIPETFSARAGDDIVMTKWAGLYGTAVVASRKADELKGRYYPDFIEETDRYFEYLSVKREIEIARQFDTSVMYGIAKEGIFGALWEVAVAGKVGLFVDLKKIPLKQQTVEICNYYDINPYKLSGYGALLIGTSEGEHLAAALRENGIEAAVIGRFTSGNDRVVVNDDEVRYLEPPRGSELWKFLCDGGKES